MSLQSTPEAGQLVRSYSLELENNLASNVPVGDLHRAFIEKERRLRKEEGAVQKWHEFYEPWEPVDEYTDPTTKILREKAVLLSHAWKVFRTTIPQSEQEKLEGQVPSVSGLVGMVDSVAKEWQNKRATSKSGRFMQHFTGFCQTLDAHSYMLEVLPVGNEYVSLFTGVLKTVINASSNHEEVATKIGEALSRISVHVIQCEKEVRLHRTKTMLEKIANLYAHIFLYLQDTMEWYQKRVRSHIRDAFRQNFFDKFESTIVNIQNLSQDLLREANVSSMAEIRQVRLTTEETLDEVKFGQFDTRLSMDKVSRELAEIKFQYEQLQLAQQREAEERRQLQINESKRREEFQKQIFLQIGDSVHQSFIGIAQQMLNDGYIRANEQPHRPMGFIETSESHLTGVNSYDRGDMILGSNRLLDMFSMISREGQCKPPFGSVSLDTTATSRLKEWTIEPKINFLAIAGRRPKGPEPPPMKVVASMCIEFAIKAELPVISYFCSLPPKEDLREGNTPEVQEVLSLTYSLTRQLIERLPVQFQSKFDFSKERLALLDGSLITWSTAITLLRDLVKTIPKPLFCIVDGFQKLDDRNTEGLLEELVNVLKFSGSEGTNTDHLNVLFTTTGKSRALLKCLDPSEYVLADRDGAAGSSARRAGNRRFIV